MKKGLLVFFVLFSIILVSGVYGYNMCCQDKDNSNNVCNIDTNDYGHNTCPYNAKGIIYTPFDSSSNNYFKYALKNTAGQITGYTCGQVGKVLGSSSLLNGVCDKCYAHQLNCQGKNCGDDGCGGSCGSCFGNQVCKDNSWCCTPNCNNAPNVCSGEKFDNGCSAKSCIGAKTCSGNLKCKNGNCVQCLSNTNCPTGQSCKNNVCTDLRCNGVKANKLAKKELCLVCDGRGGLLDVNYMNGLDCGNGFCFSGKCIKYYSLAEYTKKCPSNSKNKEDVILDERQCCETSKTDPVTCSHEPDASCTSVYIAYDLTWLEKKLVGDTNICKIKECNSPKKPVDCSKYGSGTCCSSDQICSHYGSGNTISPACGYSPEKGCPSSMEQCGDKTEEGNFVCCKKNIEKCETNFGRGRCLIISCDKNQFLCKGQNYFTDSKQQNICCNTESEFCFHSPNGLPLCSEIPKEVLDGSVEIVASPPVTKSLTARIIGFIVKMFD